MASFLHQVIGVAAAACVGGVLLTRSFTPAGDAPTQTAKVVSPQRPSPPAAPARAFGAGPLTIEPGPGGHFFVQAEIAGRRIPMMVDTGATVIALTLDDASAIGVYPSPADFTASLSTANGTVRAARATLREVRIDSIVARDVSAIVLPRGAISVSLLGMSFLQKLRGFEIADGRMVLRP